VAGAARRVGSNYNELGAATEALGGRTQQLGRDTAAAYNSLGENISSDIRAVSDVAVKYQDHQEISHGAATFAQLQDDLTQQWNATAKNADPNDPAVAAEFREKVLKPAIDKFKEGFTTENSQKFAESKANSLTQHMFEKTSADMSTLAGIAVRKNLHDATTSLSNTAITDPSSVPTLLKQVDLTVGGIVGSSPTLTATDAARVHAEVSTSTKAEIVKSGAVGAIQKSANPEATADEWIKKYPDYISGTEAKMLAGNARQQIRARNYDYEMNRRREKEVAQDRSTEKTNQYLIDVRSQDPKIMGDPTGVKVLNDPNLTKQDKNNLLNYIDRQLKPETDARMSQTTFVGLLRDLRAPDADPDAVMQKAWDARLQDPGKPGSMSEKDFNQFRTEVIGRKTPEGAALERDRSLFFKQYAGTIAGRTYDPATGSPKLYAAEIDARRMETMLKGKGLDPHLAYDPASEYFIGKPERIQKYQGSMQGDLTDKATQPAKREDAMPAIPPIGQRSPGLYETPKGKLRWTGTGWVQP
jgi:hypothetical protein